MLNDRGRNSEKSASTLGLRLEPQLQSQLAKLARLTGRTKSEIAREAVRDYLDRHDEDAEFKRQVKLLQQSYTPEDEALVGARTDRWLQMLDDEDGGYDWGENGPPA